MKCKKWEVWLAKIKFKDSNMVKVRPVLIIDSTSGHAISLKMSSHIARDSSDYPLKHWTKTGLDRETVVRTSKICYIMDSDLLRMMGRLTEYDLLQIQSIMLQ